MGGMWLAATAAFNLVCNVTTTLGGETSRSVEVLRVDLDQQRYCWSKCVTTFPLARVSASEIIFQDGRDRDTGLVQHLRVNRETGDYLYRSRGAMLGRDFTGTGVGTCVAKPFTGFPRPKF